MPGLSSDTGLSRVTPTKSGRQPSSLRWIALTGAAMMIAVLILALVSTNGNDNHQKSVLDESEFRGMPDPDQAVFSADNTVESVLPFHNLEEAAAGTFGASPVAPRRLTRPKYATMLGKEAALHASSQPFLVSLERGGQKVPGAVAPFGEYAPVTPAYSNPLAQFIPNVTYYPVGKNSPSTGGDRNVPLFNPFDSDNSTQGFFSKKVGLASTSTLSQAQESAKVSEYLAHLYTALATEQAASDEHKEQESKIEAAIARVQKIAGAQTAIRVNEPQPVTRMVEPQMQEQMPTQQLVVPSIRYSPLFPSAREERRSYFYRRNPQYSVEGQEQIQGNYMRPAMRIVSPTGPAQSAENDMPEFA